MQEGGSYMNDMDRKIINSQQDRGLEDLMKRFGVVPTAQAQDTDNKFIRQSYPLSDFEERSVINYDPSEMDLRMESDFYRRRGGSTPRYQRGGSKNWIKGAIKKPGALRATAKRAGAIKKDGTIKKSWLQQQAKKGNSKTAQRARLALTLGKMKRR